jgi:quinol monooxygenase YgiN
MSHTTLIRIVRLTFSEQTIDAFDVLFKKHKEAIASQPGCQGVELVKDESNSLVRATVSRWKDEESLNTYRKSALFGEVWPATKALFAESPQVQSYITMR